MEVCVQLRVVGGENLPKTDTFSEIDPFVRVYFNDVEVGVTHAFDDDANPVWLEDFYVDTVLQEDGLLCGTLSLQLFDEDLGGAELVGTADLDLSTILPEDMGQGGAAVGEAENMQRLPIVYRQDRRGKKWKETEKKSGRSAQLLVQVIGYIKSLSTYAEELEEVEGLVVDEEQRCFTLPLPLPGDGLLPGPSSSRGELRAGIRYGPRATEFVVLCCATGSGGHSGNAGGAVPVPPSAIEFKYPKRGMLRVKSTQYAKPMKTSAGLRVVWETALLNLDLDAQLNKLSVRLLGTGVGKDTHDIADILDIYDFTVGSAWQVAAKELGKSASLDPAAQHIYLPLPGGKKGPSGKAGAAGGGPAGAAAAAGARMVMLLDFSVDAARGHHYNANGAAGHQGQGGGGGAGGKGGAGNGKAASSGPCLKMLELLPAGGAGGDVFGFVGAGAVHWISDVYRKPCLFLNGALQVMAVHELLHAFGPGQDAGAAESAHFMRYELQDEAVGEDGEGVAGTSWKVGRVLRKPKPPKPEEENIAAKVGKTVLKGGAELGSTVLKGGAVVGTTVLKGGAGLLKEGANVVGKTGGVVVDTGASTWARMRSFLCCSGSGRADAYLEEGDEGGKGSRRKAGGASAAAAGGTGARARSGAGSRVQSGGGTSGARGRPKAGSDDEGGGGGGVGTRGDVAARKGGRGAGPGPRAGASGGRGGAAGGRGGGRGRAATPASDSD